jgi:excinuclease ABC subunit B
MIYRGRRGHDRDLVLRKLIDSQYTRNDTVLGRGRFRVKGDMVEIQPANQETAYRLSFFGDEVEQITHFNPVSGEVYAKLDNLAIWPATEYVTSKPTIERAVSEIRHELEQQVKHFEADGRMLEAHRIRQRTEYDLELLQELGFCTGIENYSRILEGRAPGSHPFTLPAIPNDFVVLWTSRTRPFRSSAGCTGATARASGRWSTTGSASVGARQPAAPLDEFLGGAAAAFVSATPGRAELRH